MQGKSDVVVSKLDIQKDFKDVSGIKCAVMLENGMQCTKKAEYKRVSETTEKPVTDYLCTPHYMRFMATEVGKKSVVRQ